MGPDVRKGLGNDVGTWWVRARGRTWKITRFARLLCLPDWRSGVSCLFYWAISVIGFLDIGC